MKARERSFVPAEASAPGDEPRRIYRGATIDGPWRYWLYRDWSGDETLEGTGPLARPLFVMLNPSKADAHIDDPTCRRCMGYAERWGYSGVEIVNLFAFRATKPEDLWRTEPEDRVGPDNDRAICAALDRIAALEPGPPVVVAWGVVPPGARDRVDEVLEMIRARGLLARCLGRSANGHPKHPLYLAKDAELVVYPPF